MELMMNSFLLSLSKIHRSGS